MMFMWGAVSHMLTPVGEMGLKTIANEEPVVMSLQANLKEPGFYFVPGMDMSKEPTPEEEAAWTARYEKGPNAIVIYSPSRSPQLPDVPSSTEAGMPELNLQNWYGILAPAGLPRPVFQQLEAAFMKARLDPEAAPRFDEGGAGAPMGAAAFRTRWEGEFDRLVPLIQRLGIRAE